MTVSRHLIEAASAYPATYYGATGDNSTNDTAALNAWIDEIPAGGIGLLPAGNYRVKAFDIDKKVTILAAPGAVLRNYDTSDNTTSANYVLGIKAGVRIHGLSVIGSVSTTATAPATYQSVLVYVDGSDNPYEDIRLIDCHIEGGRHSLSISEAKRLWLDRSTIKSGWEYGILGPVNFEKVWITNSAITDTKDNAGLRIGGLTETELSSEIVVANNFFSNNGVGLGQDACDISTNNASRVLVVNNTGYNNGEFLELKCASTAGSYTDALVAGNVSISSAGATYGASIRINTSTGGAQDHIQRINVIGNHVAYEDGAGSACYVLTHHTDCTVKGNVGIGAAYGLRLINNTSGIETVRPVIEGNRFKCSYGVYITANHAAEITDPVIANNDIQYTEEGIRSVVSGGNGSILVRPTITGNRLRCTDSSGTGHGMDLTGVQGGMIAGNDIRALGAGIVISDGLTNTTVCITKNTIDCTDATHGLEGVDVNASTGTFQIFDNTILTDTDQRGWTDAGAGATVLAGTNKRGVRSAIPTDAGALNDTFDDSAPAAGATKWVCTTAGGSGAATWTAQ